MPARSTRKVRDAAKSGPPKRRAVLRAAKPSDARAISVIDARHTGQAKPLHWKTLLADCTHRGGVALVAEEGGEVVGYLLGEVRAWEFGSPPVGWIYATSVHPDAQGSGVGKMLVDAARERFAAAGVKTVRTMVQRENVMLLRFFRSAGFALGPFVELEVALGDA